MEEGQRSHRSNCWFLTKSTTKARNVNSFLKKIERQLAPPLPHRAEKSLNRYEGISVKSVMMETEEQLMEEQLLQN